MYFGSGRKKTGDWCFKDGYVTFESIMQLYNTYFIGKHLKIVSDCSYSGNWVQLVMDYLDKCKITACLHSARASGKLIDVVASCQAHEIPFSLFFAARGFFNDKNTAFLFYVRPIQIAVKQNMRCFGNITMICTAANLDSECLLPPFYTSQKKRVAEKLHLQHFPSEWNLLLVIDDDEDIHNQILLDRADVEEFGTICKSGKGKVTEDVKKWIDKEYPGHLFNWSLY